MSQSLAYIEALNRATGLELSLSASGAAELVLDGRGVLLQWLEERQMFVVYIELAPLSGWRDHEVLRQLMAANFLLLESGGGALSYDTAANMVGINYALPVYGLSPEDFVKKLDAMMLMAETWRERLNRMAAEQERAAVLAHETDGKEEPVNATQMIRV